MPPAEQTPPPAGDLSVYAVPIEDLRPDRDNARRHPARNRAAIKASLQRFGQRKPLVLGTDRRTVIAGNGTLQVALELGWTSIWVTVFPGTDEQAKAYAIADNRTGELSEWDNDLLQQILTATPAELLPATGFDLADLDSAPDPAAALLSGGDSPPGDAGDRAVIILCDNELDQQRTYDDLTAAGFECRVVST